MRKRDCLRWAKALINGKYRKQRETMTNLSEEDGEKEPTSCCCLGVFQETLKPEGYEKDRLVDTAEASEKWGLLSDENPEIYEIVASRLNDGPLFENDYDDRVLGIPMGGLTHEQIGILLLFAIESGEYKNI